MKYYRVSKTLSDIGELIPFNKSVYDIIDDVDKDYYTSLFYYNDEHKKQAESFVEFEKNGKTVKRVKGVRGITDVKTDRLVFDFDSENDVENARQDTITLCKRLKSNGFDLNTDVIIAFSGNKGFSVEAILDEEYSPEQIKKIASNLASDLESFDSKIYNASRIFRVTGTRHNKTGLYKTPLTFNELLDNDVDAIKEYSKDPKIAEMPRKVSLPENVAKMANSVEKSSSSDITSPPVLSDLDFSKKPKNLSHWKYALLHGFFPNGCRSHALMILASTFKSQGYPQSVTYRMLKGAAELQSQRHGGEQFSKDEIWENIINQVYTPLWNGGTYAEENFPDDLKKYLTKLNVPSKESIDENYFENTTSVFNTFKNFAENIDANTIRTGIEPLDKLQDFRITTSMLVGLLGAPSSGKTAVSLEIMKNVSMGGENVAFYSLDMGLPLVYQRLAQKVSGYSTDKLVDIFKNGDIEEIEKIKQKIDDQYKNVHFCFKSAMNTESIKKSIMHLEEKSGKKIRLAVVDYLECISSSVSDPTAKISNISQELKDIANDLDICILLLLQPPKRVGDPSQEILSYNDIKGAATVAQAASIILSVWREGFNPKTVEEDNYISFALVKNRMGKLAQVDCGWDGLTGKVSTLDTIEIENLADFRKAKAQREDNDSDI